MPQLLVGIMPQSALENYLVQVNTEYEDHSIPLVRSFHDSIAIEEMSQIFPKITISSYYF